MAIIDIDEVIAQIDKLSFEYTVYLTTPAISSNPKGATITQPKQIKVVQADILKMFLEKISKKRADEGD